MPEPTPSSHFSHLVERSSFIILLCLFGVIAGIRILLSGLIVSPQIFADELAYDTIAREIYNGVLLTSHIQYPEGPFSPGYSFIASLAYFFSPDKYVVYHYMLGINAILTTSIIFPAYYLLKSVTSKGIAFSGSVIVALLPAVTMNTYVLMSEALFIPLTLFSVLFVKESLSTDKPGFWDILAGLSIFLLYFTRATGISMIIALVLTLGWMFKTGHFQFTEAIKKKIIFIVGPGLLLFLIWVFDQLLMKGSLPSGYSTDYYITLITEVLTRDPGHLVYVFMQHIDYLLLGSFIIFPILAIIAGYSLIRPIFQIDSPGQQEPDAGKGSIPVLLYCSIFSIILFLFTLAHMCNLSYEYSICGRYVDAIIPLIIIGGIIGLTRLTQAGDFLNYLKPALVYLIITVIITWAVMLPFAHQPNNNAAIFYLYSLIAGNMIAILTLGIGGLLIILCAGVIKFQKGIIPFLMLIILLTLFSSFVITTWEIQSARSFGAPLPLCQAINNLPGEDMSILWDTSSETDGWDQMVYFTLKFWLGDRVSELDQKTQPTGKAWLVTKAKKGEPVLISGDYRVIPYQVRGVSSQVPSS
ncbi:hypothetical protein [Methanospirillum lacunae]|uniref:Glycosyltransferase RgtA/B/C/D-like domain-containing protein n=2 Tax=Methanospirillum lacunae TaxID=668570 RepID=A0A2V2N721_9EURY|nr:hypothetical protein [Methanospirillum lacunae]PWR72027.1 hypothetical protein DK846_08535 [Methanospirillum lacunae]